MATDLGLLPTMTPDTSGATTSLRRVLAVSNVKVDVWLFGGWKMHRESEDPGLAKGIASIVPVIDADALTSHRPEPRPRP